MSGLRQKFYNPAAPGRMCAKARADRSNMKIWTESPLKLVEPDSPAPDESNTERRIHMARNSCESFQILLYTEDSYNIEGIDVEGDGKDGALAFRYHYQETVRFSKTEFQDPLSNERTMKGEANRIQSIWITVYAPADMEPGVYQKNMAVRAAGASYGIVLEIKVYPAVLPGNREAAFSTEYWMNTVNFWFRYPGPDQLDFFHYHYGCEKYSEKWWDLNRKIALHMKENRINVLFVRTQDLLLDGGSTLDEQGNYHFCWELFDKWTGLFDSCIQVKHFAGYHLVVQTEGKHIYLIRNVDGKPQIGIAPIKSAEADNWMRQFLTALYAHLQERGDTDRWLQHVEDEPAEAESWKYAREWVQKCMPGIRCMDAIDHQEPMTELQGKMDLWIPRVDVYENNREFYDYRMARGDGRWVYNCCEPHHQNYANKFLGWPLLHNRVLPWACFVNHFSGFLHWGYDFWDPYDEWFGLNPDARIRGDGYIVYPDPANNSIRNSVRMISTRDGAQDFELLKLLADKNPKMAYTKAKEVALRFNDFNWETENLERVRIEILEALSS